MGAEHPPLSTLSVRELIDLLAGTEERIRLLRRTIPGTACGPEDGPDAVRHLLRRQKQVIAELRRRRSTGSGGTPGSAPAGRP